MIPSLCLSEMADMIHPDAHKLLRYSRFQKRKNSLLVEINLKN